MKRRLAIAAAIALGAASFVLVQRRAAHDPPRDSGRPGALVEPPQRTHYRLAATVPRLVHIPDGTYAGYTIALIPEAVWDPAAKLGIPLPIEHPISTWADYPVPVCIDTLPRRTLRPEGIGFPSTVARAGQEFNDIVGKEMLRVVAACPGGPDVFRYFPGIVVRLMGPIRQEGVAAPFAVTYVSKQCVTAGVAHTGCVLAQIQHAEILIRADDQMTLREYNSGGVIQHEFLHALGLAHTCVAPSIMFAEFTEKVLTSCRERATLWRYPPPRHTSRPSPYDVAHLFVLEALKGQLWRRSAAAASIGYNHQRTH